MANGSTLSTGQSHENRNPANKNDLIGTFPLSNERDLNAPSLRQRKRKSPGVSFRLRNAPKSFIRRRTDSSEQGSLLSRHDSRDGQGPEGSAGRRAGSDRHVYYMAGEGRRMYGHTTPSELPDKFMMSVRQPLGVCGLITPWNFPMAIPSWKIMPALVCGNTVVLKPARTRHCRHTTSFMFWSRPVCRAVS